MRKLIIALAVVLVAAGAGGGWWAYSRFLRDPVAVARDLTARGDIRGAQLELRNAVLKHPDNAEAHFELGRLQLQVGDAVAAEKELKAAIAHGSKAPAIPPLLARSYLAQQKFRDLLKEFSPIGLPPADAGALLVSRALAQLAVHDPASARASAIAAERLAPTLADAPLAIARIAAASGDRGQALLKVEDALKLDPKLLEGLGLKADLLRGQGNLVQALATLDTAVAVAPYLPQVRLARARALLIAGEDSKARDDLENVLRIDSKNTLGLFLYAILQIRAKDWQSANISLQKIQPVLNQVPRGEYYYALAKSNVNQMEQASEAIGHYLARHRGDPDGYRLRARIELELGHRAEATEALKQAALLGGNQAPPPPGMTQPEASPDEPKLDSPEALTRLAAEQLASGDTSGAERDLEESLEAQPTHADTAAAQVVSALAEGDADRAAAALEKLAHQSKAQPEVLGNLTGMVRMAQLDFAGAEAAWQDAVKAAPMAVPPRVNLARVLALTGKREAAEKTLNEILQAQPSNRAALRALLELLASRNQTDGAIAAVRAARAAAPGMVGLTVTEAALQARKGDFVAAFGVLDQVPLEQALSPLVLTTRAQILLAQGKKQDAADAFRQILLNNPNDQTTRRRLIELLVQLDKGEAAQKLADDGLALSPGNAALMQFSVSLTYRLKGLEAALAVVDKLAQDPTNQPSVRLLRGGLYMTAKKYPEAAAAYAAEIKDVPFTTLAVGEAAALRAAGHADEATALLRDWVAKQPDPAVAESLASLDIEANRLDIAEKNLDTVLAARPNDPVALNNLAWLYSLRGDKRAHALAHKAYLLAPTAQTADTLGWTMLHEGGQAQTAATLLRHAAQQLPSDPTIHYHLAVALKETGDNALAVAVLNSLLEKGGSFADRAAAQKLHDELAALPASPPAAAKAP